MKLTGRIQSGVGQGIFFTRLDWVVAQFREAMGFAPCPGTLNVRIREEDLPRMGDFFRRKDFAVVPPTPGFCAGYFKKVLLDGIPAAAVFPAEDVRIHGGEIVEIVAGCHIKDTLRLQDGDTVVIDEFHENHP